MFKFSKQNLNLEASIWQRRFSRTIRELFVVYLFIESNCFRRGRTDMTVGIYVERTALLLGSNQRQRLSYPKPLPVT